MAQVAIGLLVSFGLATSAHALPTFQVYIDGATAADMGGDEDTWFSAANPFTLVVVGAYGPHTVSLTKGTLLLSIPEGETGTVTFASLGDGIPTLLRTAGSGLYANPSGNANEEHLTNVAGLDGYDGRSNFLPAGLTIPNHFPTGDGISDFLLYSVGSFSNTESNLFDYNADGGIVATAGTGEEKRYQVSFTGFTRVHLDLYGLEKTRQGRTWQKTWDSNPGSHDATWKPGQPEPRPPVIPEPSTWGLMSLGLSGLGLKRWRRRI
jgi:hypothetical protein